MAANRRFAVIRTISGGMGSLTAEALAIALLMAAAILAAVLPQKLFLADGMEMIPAAGAGAVVVMALTAISHRLPLLHFNPLFTFAATAQAVSHLFECARITAAQIAGGFAGVALAHIMLNFDAIHAAALRPFALTAVLSEFIAAFVFVFAVCLTKILRRSAVWPALTAGTLFFAICLATPHHSFVNPAATLARTLTTTALTLSPQEAAAAAAAQLAGAFLAVIALRHALRFLPKRSTDATAPGSRCNR